MMTTMAPRRTPPRRERVRTRPTVTEAPPPPVKVAVVTSPRWNNDGFPSLRNDVALVKAAVLYADEVEVLGLAAGLVHSLGLSPESQNMSLREMMELTDRVTGSATLTPAHRENLIRAERAAKRGQVQSPEIRRGLEEIERVAAHARGLLRTGQMDVIESTGADELTPALDAGLVTVANVGGDLESALLAVTGRRDETTTGEQVQEWIDEVTRRLLDHRTRLLFDDQSEDLVRELLAEGVVPMDIMGLRLAGKAAVGAGLVSRLPTFTHTPMDELLDFRRDMATPLKRYRSAVSRFSRQLPPLTEAELRDGVNELWETDVEPALLEIKETMAESSFLKEAARAAGKSVGVYMTAGAGIWMGLGAVSDLSQLVTAAIATAPKTSQIVADAALATQAARRPVRKHELFYLHAISSG